MMHPPAYNDFRAVVDALSLDASARDVLEALVDWVGRHQCALSGPPFSDYNFDLISQMVGRVDCFRPAELDDGAVERLKRSVAGMTRGRSSAIAQLIRDLIDELLAPEVDWICPNCGEQFGLLFGCIGERERVLICRVCGAARCTDGSMLSGKAIRYLEMSELDGL